MPASFNRSTVEGWAGISSNVMYRFGFLEGEVNQIFEAVYKVKEPETPSIILEEIVDIIKLLIDFNADPKQSALTLVVVVQKLSSIGQLTSERLELLTHLIEKHSITDVSGVSGALRLVEDFVTKPSNEQNLNSVPAGPLDPYPLTSRKLRPSQYPYRVKLSYGEGLRQLADVAKDLTNDQEGIFIFDPKTTTWYSASSFTEVDAQKGKVIGHILDEHFDLSYFSQNPTFVHIHPHALESVLIPHFDNIGPYGELLSSYLATMPSAQDLRIFETMLHKSSKKITPRFVIIHGHGQTTVAVDFDDPTFASFLGDFSGLKQDVMQDFLNQDHPESATREDLLDRLEELSHLHLRRYRPRPG
jgi:hypothetical protein